ncbi:MAG: hypothetical protein GKS02_04080 [Alphaproteobacteria bacterium]|nr:hypothetical protein [Alphaproteobacteria bacterium]
MPSLDAIGSSRQTGSLRGDETPAVRLPEPNSEQPVERVEKLEQDESAETRTQAQRVELPSRAFQARLNYDEDADEVIVEILDPETGDVRQQLPAKELPDDIRALISDSGPLVETFA